MKKISLVVFFAASMVHPVLATPLGLGVRAGVNMANETGYSQDSLMNTDVLFGLNGGVFVEIHLTDSVELQPEADFSMKGFTANFKNTPELNMYGQIVGYISASSYTLNYNYLEFPILLKAPASLAPHLIGNLSVGPSIEVPLTTYAHSTVSGSSAKINSIGPDWGVVFGAGLEMDNFLLDLRYDLGMSSVNQNDSNGPQNSVLSLNLGYRIQ